MDPVPGDHLGAARRRRRSAVRRAVTTPPEPDWKASREQAAAGVGHRRDRISGDPRCWAARGGGVSRASSTSTAMRAAGRFPVMAFWHGRILPALYFFRRRGIVVITSDNFDGEWIAQDHPPVRVHDRRAARRRATRRASALKAKRQMEAGHPSASPSTGRADRRWWRSLARCGWRRSTGNPVLPFHIEARVVLDRAELGCRADSQAVQPRRAGRRRAVLRASRRRRRRRSRRTAWSSEQRLMALQPRALDAG